jgi:hypothetical protein
MKGHGVLFFLLTFSLPIFSQKGYELGGFIGVSNYIGDINPDFSLKTPEPAIAGIARYNFNTRTSLRLDVGAGRIAGKDALSENDFQRARNLSFRTDYVEASMGFEFNFFNLRHGSRDQYFTPYLFGGFALAYYNPKAKIDNHWYALRYLGTEGQRVGNEYAQVAAGTAYGFGIKLDVTDVWSFNAEIAVRQLGTDYLDDVSTVYPNMAELEARRGELAVRLSDRSGELGIDPPIGAPGRQRGDSKNNDVYYTFRIGMAYYIGFVQCPKICRGKY